jgi:O-antigen chain-terminating methyltransferase
VAVDSEADDSAKIAELTAVVQAVRERVRARYPEASNGVASNDVSGGYPRVSVPVADLMPIVHARDAAQAKIAAIGSVNPRRGGFVNNLIQSVKQTIARALQWFVRDQIVFNRESVSAIEAVIEALNDHNRILVSLAAQTNDVTASLMAQTRDHLAALDRRIAEVHASIMDAIASFDARTFGLQQEARELKDIRLHWAQLRAEWDHKVAANEIQYLRTVAELQASFKHGNMVQEGNFRDLVASQHKLFEAALERSNREMQERFWADLHKMQAEYERLIHNELHLIRQRAAAAPASTPAPPSPATRQDLQLPDFDYGRFAERFRGNEDYVRRGVAFYKPFFEGRENVLDIGCGRGEFLELMRECGVQARGIDLSEESVALCRHKGLSAEVADLFPWLAGQPEQMLDGIFSAQVVEHLDPKLLPEMVRLCASRLRTGGILAIETPNPECLAIFATHFFLDPTHTRPVPHPLMAFYMEEAGIGQIEVHKLSPASDTMLELASLPEDFRGKFFGGLDYAIIGRRL